MVEGLFPKRLEILRFLAGGTPRAAARANAGAHAEGRSPTIQEIGRAVGLRSSQTVHHHLRKLEQEGYLHREEGRPRTAKLTEKGWQAVGEAPILGRVAAGRGLEAIATGDEAYSLMAELLTPRGEGKSRYLLRVSGQSMTEAWIGDGSILVVEEDEDPPDGEVVVALLGGGEEVTVKRLFREGENVRLRAENGDHTDIVVSADDVVVQGRVVSVIHSPKRK